MYHDGKEMLKIISSNHFPFILSPVTDIFSNELALQWAGLLCHLKMIYIMNYLCLCLFIIIQIPLLK